MEGHGEDGRDENGVEQGEAVGEVVAEVVAELGDEDCRRRFGAVNEVRSESNFGVTFSPGRTAR